MPLIHQIEGLVLIQFQRCNHFQGLKGGLEKLGLVLAVLGAILLSSVLFFECFILKGLANADPSLIDPNGSFYNYAPFKYATLTSGLIFSSGMVLLCQALLREKAFKTNSLLMVMIGSPLFSIIYIPGNFRLFGVLIYCIGLISIGVKMLKSTDSSLD